MKYLIIFSALVIAASSSSLAAKQKAAKRNDECRRIIAEDQKDKPPPLRETKIGQYPYAAQDCEYEKKIVEWFSRKVSLRRKIEVACPPRTLRKGKNDSKWFRDNFAVVKENADAACHTAKLQQEAEKTFSLAKAAEAVALETKNEDNMRNNMRIARDLYLQAAEEFSKAEFRRGFIFSKVYAIRIKNSLSKPPLTLDQKTCSGLKYTFGSYDIDGDDQDVKDSPLNSDFQILNSYYVENCERLPQAEPASK